MKRLLGFILIALYTALVVVNGGYHFWHGWAHADAEREDARRAAAACRENYAVQKRHSQQCAHDEADADMNAFWLASRALALEFTFCPPTSCAELALSFADVTTRVGSVVLVAAAGAIVAFMVGLKLYSMMGIDQAYVRADGAHEHPLCIEPNTEYAVLEGVRQRGPVVTEIT